MEKFEEDLIRLKNKINSMTLSDEFKDNLSKKLDMEYERLPEKKRFFIPKQIVIVCMCCILLTGCVFADSIGNVITNFFSNTSKEMEEAIESGELQSLNMDYVEHDGVSIKVDYAMVKDDSLYLVFNVLSEEEIDNAFLEEYEIKNDSNEIVYNSLNEEYVSIEHQYGYKRLSDKNIIIFANLKNIGRFEEYNRLNICLNKIVLENINNNREISNEWILDVIIKK